jgi:hypothetical protein
VELILTFPILFALFLGMIEFSMLLYARQQLSAASREGARVAALGGQLPDVEQTVRRYLGAGRLGEAQISLTDVIGQPLPEGTSLPGESIEVWVRLPANRAAPDLLRFVGYSIQDEEIVARTVMRRE